MNELHNPIVTNLKEIEVCKYHKKTGVCKYDLRCSKIHNYCEFSNTLLFQNMYSGLQQLYNSVKEDYDCGMDLIMILFYLNF